jgi:hypothetical protein
VQKDVAGSVAGGGVRVVVGAVLLVIGAVVGTARVAILGVGRDVGLRLGLAGRRGFERRGSCELVGVGRPLWDHRLLLGLEGTFVHNLTI